MATIIAGWVKSGLLAKQGPRYVVLEPRALEVLAAPVRHGLRYRSGMPLARLTTPAPPAVELTVTVHAGGPVLDDPIGLRGDELIVGREPGCGLWLDDRAISRRHCRIFRGTTGGRHWVEDLCSVGGTRLNGRPVRRAVLHDGDRIQVGASLIEVRLRAAPLEDALS